FGDSKTGSEVDTENTGSGVDGKENVGSDTTCSSEYPLVLESLDGVGLDPSNRKCGPEYPFCHQPDVSDLKAGTTLFLIAELDWYSFNPHG
ncbi:hypothetical protein Tco_0615479, partial [Tanacetum coccineum]